METEAVPEVMTRNELILLQRLLKTRKSWHEPDEQGVSAYVEGTSFDNASVPDELEVILQKDDKPFARVNLAMLFAWATGYVDGSE